MAEQKAVFMTALPGKLEEMVVASTPKGFTTTTIASQATDEEKIEALADSEFILGFGPTLSEAVLRSAPQLKLIQVASAGYDTLDLELLQQFGITLANSSGINAPVVAEHTVALILAVLRKLPQAAARVAEGGWLMDSPATDPTTYHDLLEKRVGIVGFGNIARQVVRRLRGFQCRIQVHNRSPISEEQKQELGIEQIVLPELFETSDVITLHVPLTPETKHLVGRDELARMKPSTILVNTSRGEVVDEAALIEALKEGKILGAGLDVTEQEPPAPDSPLRTMDNVVLTPHVGGSLETMERIFSFCWQNIKDALEGREPRNVVSP